MISSLWIMGSSGNGLDRLHEEGKEGMRENIPSVINLIGAVFILSILPIPGHALTPNQVFDKVKNTIVVVKTFDDQGKLKSFGSGVLLSYGKVATNCHVVAEGASYKVGRGKQLVPATLYAEDEEKDICILDAKGIKGEPVQMGKATSLKVGDPVYAVGAPQGLELSLSDGIVSQLRGGPPPLIQVTVAISPGSSGGGLFDREGRLVGLTTLYIEGGQNLNFAMPVEWIGEVKPDSKPATKKHADQSNEEIEAALRLAKDLAQDSVTDGLTTGNWEKAINDLNKVIKLDPKQLDYYCFLSLAYTRSGKPKEALKVINKAIKIIPNNERLYQSQGHAHLAMQDYKSAINSFSNAIKVSNLLSGLRPALHRDRGAAYSDYGEYQKAIHDFDIAINLAFRKLNREKDQGSSIVLLNKFDLMYGYKSRGLTYGKVGNYKQAINDYDEAIELFPNSPENADTYYMRAMAIYIVGSCSTIQQSITDITKSIELDGKNPQYYYQRAVLYTQTLFCIAREDFDNIAKGIPFNSDERMQQMDYLSKLKQDDVRAAENLGDKGAGERMTNFFKNAYNLPPKQK
jgi:tetratricopeptide (TPR) repeat protein